AVVLRTLAGLRRFGGQELRFAPLQTVAAGRELYALTDAIFNSGPVAPHRPKLAGMMRQIIVLVDAAVLVIKSAAGILVGADIADHGVFAGQAGQAVEIDPMRILRHPFARQGEG